MDSQSLNRKAVLAMSAILLYMAVGAAGAQTATKSSAGTRAAPQSSAQEQLKDKVSLLTVILFDFQSSAINSVEERAKLDQLVGRLKDIQIELVIAAGHVDTQEAEKLPMLSIGRAEAVKAYFVVKGMLPERIYTEGKGSGKPATADTSAAGMVKNRRAEVEVVGIRIRR